ncbi:adenylate/guanylate cyclase domain-containing protein [Geitlerinema sp. PCC 9228]|uniref:CHASE2 domain-containing protein n=1 Tax=Geitlerinema sp. PCC 9228 TaxID=111611 RepID=UPI000A0188F7|nr:adenylate/guanylate cyclase domain-containing protein [Geitlerinema sp. PCC 9228]
MVPKLQKWHSLTTQAFTNLRTWLTGHPLPRVREGAIIAIAAVGMTAIVHGVRHSDAAVRLELIAYDQMVRLSPDGGMDERIVIVGITENDIRQQDDWPLRDRVLAQLLQRLQAHNPRTIGIDIYRDMPMQPGHQQLVEQLQAPNVFGITNLGNGANNGVKPPPSLPSERVGFNDVVLDLDGVVRRNFLSFQTSDRLLYSFSLRLALHYLQDQVPPPTGSESNPSAIRWGEATFFPLSAQAGAYENLDNRGYQILLQYRTNGAPGRTISLQDALHGNFNPAWIEDKIVIVGTVAPSGRDLFFTPYSATEQEHPKMPGVYIHAQMVSQLLSVVRGEQQLFWFWQPWQELVWILVWAGLGGILACWCNHPLAIAISEVSAIAVLWAIGFGLFLHQGWVPLVAPTAVIILSGGIVVASQAYQSRQQEQMVMKLLGQNVSQQVALALWKNRDYLLKSGKMPGQKLIATILFADIKNFSTTSEQMPPEKLMDWLNEYLAAMAEQVQVHHGIINKFTGDGLMAVFGVPVPRHTDEEIAADAQAAVSCALAIRDRVAGLNHQSQRKDLPPVQVRIGIFTGPVVVGSLGSKQRLEYGVIGDSVNIASRLESCEKHCQPSDCRILTAAATQQYLGDRFQVESWGAIALKGKHQVVDVYRIIDWNF